jgi:hypothetical protein
VLGVGFGKVAVVGEFENGPFETVTDVFGPTDIARVFGGFGYGYADGSISKHPSARARKADGQLSNEFWNGNGYIALYGKQYNSLCLVRVDTSVGSVSFSRCASALSVARPRFLLTTGQVLVLDIGSGNVTSTFTGAVATVTGTGASFATIAAGETLTIGYDAQPDFTVTFLAADTTVGAVVSRINAAAGYTMASNAAGQLKLDGRIGGTSGQIRVVGGTGRAKCGLTIANTAGTGNVANISQVTHAEVKTIVEAAVAGTLVESLPNGKLRIANKATPLTGTIQVDTTTTATDFGFTLETTYANAATGTANGIIPAGTVVKVPSGVEFVTMQDITVTAASPGPYVVKVRHATDDGTGTSALVSTVTQIATPITLDAFAVTNDTPISQALSEAAIDAKYTTAIQSTKSVVGAAREINFIFSARSSNSTRRDLRTNALESSAQGCFGRMAVIRPPLGVSSATARSSTVEPGVGIYRDERVAYTWPGWRMRVDVIAQLGATIGGTGFTDDGLINVGADSFLASILSLLPPGENPGQITEYLSNVVSLENSTYTQNLTIDDYIALKAAGICAPRIENGSAFYQSGVTSVDPTSFPTRVDIERRTLTDYIEDSLGNFFRPYSKKKMTLARQIALVSATKQFMNTFLGDPDGNGQRIDGYSIDAKTPNTSALRSKGRWRLILRAQQTPSFKSIELAVTVGPTVIIEETA